MSKKPNEKRLNEHQSYEIILSSQPQSQTQKNFKTYAKWKFMTCSPNKSWTLIFFPKNAYLIGMRT